jgi:hypothetical protein
MLLEFSAHRHRGQSARRIAMRWEEVQVELTLRGELRPAQPSHLRSLLDALFV